MKKLCVVGVILCSLMLGLFALPADAQSGNNCVIVGTGLWPPFQPQDFGCVNVGITFVAFFDCNIRVKCAPPTVICLKCLLGAIGVGNPISLATGDTYIEENDIRIPGIGGGLNLARTWNSIVPSIQASGPPSAFGVNWRSTFEERVFTTGDGYMMYSRGDGSFWAFYFVGTGWAIAAPGNVTASLVQGTSTWTLTFQNGEKRLFDVASGNLTGIVDRNGNATQISRDATGRLASITDPASRHLYFGYQNNTSTLVTSVTSDIGIALAYTYDTQGRLTQVTKPDLTTISFQYNAQSLITAVLDSNGVVLELHTYDSLGRGLTSSRAGGVDAVTVSYPNH